jgi:hypothetical protein
MAGTPVTDSVPEHYASGYLHWDWVLAVGMGYCEGNATAYVKRWRLKGGIVDLRKALSYVNKVDANQARALVTTNRAPHSVVMAETARFAEANNLTPLERRFMERMATWHDADDLAEARETLFRLLDEAERGVPAPAPVPLTDSNKHADRAGEFDGRSPQD